MSVSQTACELAFWEVSPGVLNGLRKRLDQPKTQRSASLEAVRGLLDNRRVVIVRPLPGVALPPGQRLRAIRDTHQPRRFFAVGFAAETLPIEGHGTETSATGSPPPLATLVDPADANGPGTAEWIVALAAAAQRQGIELTLITVARSAGRQVAGRETWARRAGNWYGALRAKLAQRWHRDPQADRHALDQRIAASLERLL
ncbi:hypothetical protein [Botrimarina hoheduenensis]|uniref:Uncharacterized protein n=1 Tax=Botrimarina hoheduenensis TaxID=2528000 RepID=A0A5C5WET1_9BACT|nr:hypothetical protein [Botrimarina hoheduenensis]TWT48262.1 hypothetical protein Pla111_00230 [Botrimarina hoheduenensis]